MRYSVTPFLAIALLVAGAVLLHDGFQGPDLSQTAHVLGGATCLSIGLFVALAAIKDWRKWRKVLKRDNND